MSIAFHRLSSKLHWPCYARVIQTQGAACRYSSKLCRWDLRITPSAGAISFIKVTCIDLDSARIWQSHNNLPHRALHSVSNAKYSVFERLGRSMGLAELGYDNASDSFPLTRMSKHHRLPTTFRHWGRQSTTVVNAISGWGTRQTSAAQESRRCLFSLI